MGLWDLSTRKRLTVQSNSVSAISLAPEAHVVIGADLRLRDPYTGAVLRELGGAKPAKKLAFSYGGKCLGVLGPDSVSIYDTGTWQQIASFDGISALGMHVGGLAFSNRGDWLVAGDDGGWLYQLSVPDLRLLRKWRAHPERVTSVAIAPDGTLIASATGYVDGRIRLWSAETGGSVGVLEGHRAWVSSLAFSPDGALLASASADQNIRVWDVARHSVAGDLRGHFAEVWGLMFTPDGNQLVSSGKDGSIKVWRVPSLKQSNYASTVTLDKRALPGERQPVFSPDGREMIGLDQVGRVGRWLLPSLKRIGSIDALGSNTVLLCAPPQLGTLAAIDKRSMLRVWDVPRASCVTNVDLRPHGEVSWCSFAPEAKRFVVAVWPGALVEFDTSCWGVTNRVTPPDYKPDNPSCVSPDGKYVVIGGRMPTIYTLPSGSIIARLPAHRFYTDAVAFSPDGRYLATGSMDGTAKLWQTGSWHHLGTFSGHLLGVHCIAFSPDSLRLATGSVGTEAVKLWDIRTLQEVLNLQASGDYIYWLGFSPEGGTLACLSAGAGLRCWSAPPQENIPPKYP
jgi:WD40 repeat protein